MISLHSSTPAVQTPKPENPMAKKPGNIFGQPLGKTMPTEKELHLQEKNKKKGVLITAVSGVALALYSIFFFYGTALDYIKAPAEIRSLNAEIQHYDEVVLPNLQNTRELHKAAYDQEFEEVIAALELAFPEGEDKLGIVQLFESFAAEVGLIYPPFEFTSINFGQPQQQNGYLVTPVSTSIHSSLAGFDRFLALVDRSGQIYQETAGSKVVLDKIVRLMSVSNISVKYRGIDKETGKDGGVDFSVKLNMYSRPSTSN